ncbi:MKK3 [Symbiodinium sp. CCMP2592]|nr:MKK3 [Symbiodinium sp. CCMP2592]
MEAPRGPRANRSKKTLPAAFFPSKGRHVSPHTGSGRGLGEKAAGWSPRTHGDTGRQPPGGDSPPAQGRDLSCEDLTQAGEVSQAPIRHDALVFLSSCPQRHGHFAIKKMLHPPTLELFCLIEIPGAEHQRNVLRASLQEWLSRWCELQVSHPGLLVELREAFWDAPLGYPMAILCEYMPLGSLDDLIQACGGLPELALREIAQMVLEALDLLHSMEPPVVHGCLKPSQVLFTASGSPRLTFGLEQRIKHSQVVAAASGGVPVDAPGAEAHVEQSTAVDIFDLGLLLLVSALGGMDILLGAIPYARNLGSDHPVSSPGSGTASLLLNELRGCATPEAAAAAADMGYLPPASDLLFNRRFSGHFLAFVSTCLEAHTQTSPVTARDLLQHEFLSAPADGGPLVSLREMQALSRILNEAPDQDPNRFVPGGRPQVPGVAPSVAQSAQLYLMNIAQSIAPYCNWSLNGLTPRTGMDGTSTRRDASARRRGSASWETLLADSARALGLPRQTVLSALEVQLERLRQTSAR